MYLVCGEALFDVFTTSAPERSNRLTLEAVAGGSPFNVAIGLARMGTSVALLGGISTDYLGEQLRRVLREEGVDPRHLATFDAPTTLAMVALGSDGVPVYSFRGEGCADRLLQADQLPPLDDSIRGIHFGSYSLVTRPIADALAELLRREVEQRLISLDPNVRLNVEPDVARWRERVEAFAENAHLIKVSDEDIGLLYPGEAPECIARRWLGHRAEIVIVTSGARGACLYSDRHGELHVAAPTVAVQDTVGAGDTFQAALLAFLAEHGFDSPQGLRDMGRQEMDAMLRFAAQAAAITCSRRGPDLPYRSEIT